MYTHTSISKSTQDFSLRTLLLFLHEKYSSQMFSVFKEHLLHVFEEICPFVEVSTVLVVEKSKNTSFGHSPLTPVFLCTVRNSVQETGRGRRCKMVQRQRGKKRCRRSQITLSKILPQNKEGKKQVIAHLCSSPVISKQR